jgi:hypothetical protein
VQRRRRRQGSTGGIDSAVPTTAADFKVSLGPTGGGSGNAASTTAFTFLPPTVLRHAPYERAPRRQPPHSPPSGPDPPPPAFAAHHVFAADSFPSARSSASAGAGARPGPAEVPCASAGGSLLRGWGRPQQRRRQDAGGPPPPGPRAAAQAPAQSGPFAYRIAGRHPAAEAAPPPFGAGGHDAGYAGPGFAGAGYGAGYGSVAEQAAWWQAYDALAPVGADAAAAAAGGGWFGGEADDEYDMA